MQNTSVRLRATVWDVGGSVPNIPGIVSILDLTGSSRPTQALWSRGVRTSVCCTIITLTDFRPIL